MKKEDGISLISNDINDMTDEKEYQIDMDSLTVKNHSEDDI